MPLPRASSPDCVLCLFRQGHTLVRLSGYSQGVTGSCYSTALSALLYARAAEPLQQLQACNLQHKRVPASLALQTSRPDHHHPYGTLDKDLGPNHTIFTFEDPVQ